MPMKSVYRKRRAGGRKRRTYRPRRSQGYKTSITRVRTTIVPDKMHVKLPYHDIQLVSTTSMPGTFQKTYSLNALWDPEPSALNVVPLGFYQYGSLYQSYRVYAASYEISLWNGSDDTSVAGSLYISNAGGTGSSNVDPASWLAQPRARSFSIGNKSGGQSMVRLRGYVKLPGYAGYTSTQYKTDLTTSGLLAGPGGTGTSPLNNVKMFINMQNTNGSVETPLIYGSVKIIYHAEVFDRQTFTD